MQDFDEDLELERIKRAKEHLEEKETQVVLSPEKSANELQTQSNELVDALMSNKTALDIAKQQHDGLKNQKRIAKKMGDVVEKKTDADIETADLRVEQQRLENSVERARQKNELLKCREERKLLIRESRHNLQMQRFRHRKEKYGDLLLRHCRKKTKNDEGQWVYQYDEKGNTLINMPNTFVLFWLIVFDSIVMFLNQVADVFGSLNKVVWKVIWIALILLVVLVQPIREFLLSLIGIKF